MRYHYVHRVPMSSAMAMSSDRWMLFSDDGVCDADADADAFALLASMALRCGVSYYSNHTNVCAC